MGYLFAGPVVAAAASCYAQNQKTITYLQSTLDKIKINSQLYPEKKDFYEDAKHAIEMQIKQLEFGYSVNTLPSTIFQAEKQCFQKELREKYIQESRKQYPHAWHLSDWVDDVELMLKELEEFNPLKDALKTQSNDERCNGGNVSPNCEAE